MLEDKKIFIQIIEQRGFPLYIIMMSDNNFAYLKWRDSYDMIEVSMLLIKKYLSMYEVLKINSKRCIIKQNIYSLKPIEKIIA